MEHGAVILIDVREVYEWQMIRIPNTIHIPKDQLSQCLGNYVADKNHPIYLLCKAGVRSLYAAEHLLQLGYQNVYSIDGG
ncbi:MAG: sulfurtransferase, partial [Legionella sp. 40-6]